jgi:hypothetical protein
MEFDQVIAPLDRTEFLTEHWEKSWLHLPGQADRFGDLLTWDDLNAILENTRIAPLTYLSIEGRPCHCPRALHSRAARRGKPATYRPRAVVVETR